MTIDLGILIIVFLVLSFSLNILLIWFLRGLTSRLVLVSDNMSDLVDHLARYGSELKSVYEMELYYGDATIKGLVSHTQMILEVLSNFEEIYALTDNEEAEEEGPEENEEDRETEEEGLDGDETESPKKNAPEAQVQRKAVFYSGP